VKKCMTIIMGALLLASNTLTIHAQPSTGEASAAIAALVTAHPVLTKQVKGLSWWQQGLAVAGLGGSAYAAYKWYQNGKRETERQKREEQNRLRRIEEASLAAAIQSTNAQIESIKTQRAMARQHHETQRKLDRMEQHAIRQIVSSTQAERSIAQIQLDTDRAVNTANRAALAATAAAHASTMEICRSARAIDQAGGELARLTGSITRMRDQESKRGPGVGHHNGHVGNGHAEPVMRVRDVPYVIGLVRQNQELGRSNRCHELTSWALGGLVALFSFSGWMNYNSGPLNLPYIPSRL